VSGPAGGRQGSDTEAEEQDGATNTRTEGHQIAAWLRQNRAKLEILAIGGIALGGIVCMVVATLLIVWRMANP
jgi:alpha/beta superfamily hydrolase